VPVEGGGGGGGMDEEEEDEEEKDEGVVLRAVGGAAAADGVDEREEREVRPAGLGTEDEEEEDEEEVGTGAVVEESSGEGAREFPPPDDAREDALKPSPWAGPGEGAPPPLRGPRADDILHTEEEKRKVVWGDSHRSGSQTARSALTTTRN
jgi:hypothetical protein